MAEPSRPADSHDPTPPRPTRSRPPLQMKTELVVVDGDAGRELHKRQSAAVLHALRQLAERPPPDNPHGHTPDR